MDEDNFNELAGQIEAVNLMLMLLVADLESRGLIDGPQFTDSARRHVVAMQPADRSWAQVTQRVVTRITDQLDQARLNRQSPVKH